MNSITSSFLSIAKSVLTTDEGIKLSPYKDIYGNFTIGVGRLIGRRLEDFKLTPTEAMFLLTSDIEKHWKYAVEIFGEDFLCELEDARKVAILSMLFTLGKSGFLQFKNAIAAIKEKDWNRAAAEIKDSKWSHDVDKYQRDGVGRDDRIASMFVTGKVHGEYKV